ncbi:MAG: HAMP domain-containing sensor histidine kinase, partial [Hyphomicrobium sp.]
RIEALVGAHRMLLANASHELRTPLSRIRLGVELLKQGPDVRREADLERDIAELDQLVGEILLSSRLDVIEALDVRETVDLLGLAAEECARYTGCELNGETASIQGDPRLIRRMIRNLLENAARHGKPPIDVTLKVEHGRVVLVVADHGSGIPASDRDTVFEPFRKAAGEATGGGTGLGLTLVRQIARRHGGDAVYETAGLAGSQFLITLPR